MISLTGHLSPTVMPRLCTSTSKLSHRGPDDEAFYRSPQFAAGFRRLKIIDLSDDARQPMGDESGRYWIVFNGEIYNYRELRSELAGHGITFRTQSDTEVLLKSYIHWGEACLSRFNGMFAFLIWDQQEQTLFGARDRFGEKPFYYAETSEGIYFASEIKAMFPLLGEVPDANLAVIRNYIQSRQADASTETFYEGIRSIPPAHKLDVRKGSMTIRRYWQLEAFETSCTDPVERIRELFLDSVRLRMQADVPVGTCLSGGIDSGAIACCIPRVLRSETNGSSRKTFTAAYPEFDESDLVEEINRKTGSLGHSIIPTPDSLDDLSTLLRFHDEPFHSFTVFASFQVMKLARENGVTVLLNGQGADELLAGYGKYIKAYLRDLVRQGRVWAAFNIASKSRQLTRTSASASMLRTLRHSALNVVRESRMLSGIKSARRERNAIRNLGMATAFAAETNDFRLAQPNGFTGSKSALKRQLYDSLMVAHLPLYLRIEDRNSMANSLESRLPFLDHRLAEFAFSLPTSLFMQDGTNKFLFREAMSGILPDSVRQRKEKYGFPTPEVSWIYDRFRGEITDLLESPEFASRDIFDVGLVKRKYAHEVSKWQTSSSNPLSDKRSFWFRLISLELWFRNRSAQQQELTHQQNISPNTINIVNDAIAT